MTRFCQNGPHFKHWLGLCWKLLFLILLAYDNLFYRQLKIMRIAKEFEEPFHSSSEK